MRHRASGPTLDTLDALVAAKAGRTVSVVVPARDEEGTVGAVVSRIVGELATPGPMGTVLVDEVVVIDSDSTDATAERARDAGARVHAAAQILPELGSVPGKGEALWKSQFVTHGDVVVFVDADLLDWGTHFVTDLVAPLLTDPGVQLVKAVYDRPMIDAAGREVEVGGRVTELVARPWLALHRPALGGIVQPLSGEWAIRREAFASYAVPTGYGVEIAALLDTVDRFGVDAVAQVDLGRRTHRHHRHDTLGLMAVQVLAAADRRSAPGAAIDAPTEVGAVVGLTQYDRGEHGFVPRHTGVGVGERPPAATVPGWR